MAAKTKPKKLDKWASEAALSALLKFSPQESALQETADDAKSTYTQAVKQAQGAAQGTISAVDQATPQVAAIYDPTLAKVGQTGTLLGSDISKLGPVADSIKAGAASEAQTQIGNLGAARTAALTDLVQRRVAAKQGVQFATQNAHDQFVSDLTKILQSKQDLESQKGDFTALTEQQLRDASEKQAQALDIAQGHDATTLQVAAGHDATSSANTAVRVAAQARKDAANKHGKVSATGVPLLSGGAHTTASNTLSSAEGALQSLDPTKAEGRADVGQLLVNGHKSQPIYTTDPKTGKRAPKLTKAGTPVVTPDIPKTSGVLATAALDMYYDGHISRATQKRLADAGYSIKRLGLVTAAQYRKAHPGSFSGQGSASGAVGVSG